MNLDLAIELLEYFEERYDPTPIESNGQPEMTNEAYFIQELERIVTKLERG